jgi:hypothetical protein
MKGYAPPCSREAVDPELKAAVKRELRSEDFVLPKDEKEESDADA